jgi:hypothetical protein
MILLLIYGYLIRSLFDRQPAFFILFVVARDLARWLAVPMPRSRASPGSDARHRSPDMILGEAEYALFFPIYICLSFSLFAL